jgi:hypothetical protein
MKRRTQRRAGGGSAARAPREIHVRMSSPRPVESQPDVWVVNGRVIRFLDPQRPEDASAGGARAHRRIGGLLGALRHPRRHHSADAHG